MIYLEWPLSVVGSFLLFVQQVIVCLVFFRASDVSGSCVCVRASLSHLVAGACGARPTVCLPHGELLVLERIVSDSLHTYDIYTHRMNAFFVFCTTSRSIFFRT